MRKTKILRILNRFNVGGPVYNAVYLSKYINPKKYETLLILGFNHKDKKNEALNFIENLGNPYDKIGIDDTGKIAMDFGVYGLPETFLLNEKGIIIFKHVGPLTKKLYNEKINDFLSN